MEERGEMREDIEEGRKKGKQKHRAGQKDEKVALWAREVREKKAGG